VDSTCAIDRCVASYDDCNAAEGCETNVSNSAGHCGSCAGNCSNAGATEVSCSDGQCDAPTCDDTHDNCDGNDANGCETDLTTAAACGTCDNACESPTPNCVASGDTYRCQAQIVLVNAAPYPTAQATASGLTFKYRPRAGNNRLVLVAITAESKNNGIAGARPDAVRFGSTGMTAGPSQAGVVEWWSPDLFVYYLALGSATSDGAEVDVTIDGSAPPAMEGMFVQLLQLNGVRQNAPITASLGAYSGDPDTPDPATISVALPVANSGSVIYSFGGTMWMFEGSCPPGTPPPGCPAGP
jgi:hypothetical protein